MSDTAIDDPDQICLLPGLHVPKVTLESEMSPGQRRALRQTRMLAQGIHPLSTVARTTIRLHDNAARTKSDNGLRCGDCRFRQNLGYHSRSYPKCTRSEVFLSHSEVSDCRAWWGACRFFEPRTDDTEAGQ